MAGACKDRFLSMLCSSDHFPKMKALGASMWEVIVTFPGSTRTVMDDASCSAYTQLGLNVLFTFYADAVEDEESGLLALAKLRGVARIPKLLDIMNKCCTCPCHRQCWRH